MAKTRAQENRAIRQKALREQLASYKLIGKVVDISKELYEPDVELSSVDVSRLKAAADINLKLIDKYLPALKPVDADENSDEVITIKKVVREIVESTN